MARTVSRGDIKLQAKNLADRSEDDVTSGFVTDAILNRWFNTSLGIWHGMVAKAEPERFEAASPQLITGTGAESYALPADHLWTIGVDFRLTSTCDVPLEQILVQERSAFDRAPVDQACAFRIKGNTLVLLPPPSSGTYVHHYVTTAPVTTADADVIDCVNGWERWLVLDLARQILRKEESDTSDIMMERGEIKAEIEAAAQQRSLMPSRIADTRLRKWGPGHARRGDPDFWFGR